MPDQETQQHRPLPGQLLLPFMDDDRGRGPGAGLMRFRVTFKEHRDCDGERMYRYDHEEIDATRWMQAVAHAEHASAVLGRETYRIERID